MAAEDDFRKHLDLIQGVIGRLAGNSFSVKTWAVGLIAVLGGLAAKDANTRMACALLLPALCFWGLDAYYLRQERLFRKLYDGAVRGDKRAPLYSLDATPFAADVGGIGKAAYSPTVCWLHLPILIFVIGLIAYSFIKQESKSASRSETSVAAPAAGGSGKASVSH
jgi:hypothetical protein